MSTLIHFPVDIYRYIRSFLCNKEYLLLLHSCKAFTSYGIKRQTIYYQFTKRYSINYLINPDFHFQIKDRIEDPFNQVSIYLDAEIATSSLEGILNRYKTAVNPSATYIRLNRCALGSEETLSLLIRFRHVLSIRSLTIKLFGEETVDMNLDDMVGLQTLFLSQIHPCGEYHHLQELTLYNNSSVVCATPFANVPYLSFRRCPQLFDITALGGTKQIRIQLFDCQVITSVNHLANVKELRLESCPMIEDISELGNVQDLVISSCPRIHLFPTCFNNIRLRLAPLLLADNHTNPEMNCEILSIQSGKWSTNLQLSQRIKSIAFKNCTIVKDFFSLLQTLSSLQSVKFDGIQDFVDVSVLYGIRSITLARLKINSLKGLEYDPSNPRQYETQSVHLSLCSNIVDLSPIQRIAKVKIGNFYHIPLNFDQLTHVRHLTLEGIVFLNNTEIMFGEDNHLNHLVIHGCSRITKIWNLHHVQSLIANWCEGLKEINGCKIDVLRKVNISNCINLSIVPSWLRMMKDVKIRQCPLLLTEEKGILVDG